LQKSFITASNGSIDLCFCFFEQALKLLKENGKISFITPNSHFYSAAGKNLRNLMLPHLVNLVKIINNDHFYLTERFVASLTKEEKIRFESIKNSK